MSDILYVINCNVFLYWHPYHKCKVLVNLDNSILIKCDEKSNFPSIANFFCCPRTFSNLTQIISGVDIITLENQFDYLLNYGFVKISDNIKTSPPEWNKQHPVDKLMLTVSGWHGNHLEHGVNINNRLNDEPEFINNYSNKKSLYLPAPSLNEITLSKALSLRRTHRAFGVSSVSASTLSSLLFKAAGIQSMFSTPPFQKTSLRPYPSGGARHPLNIYVVIRRKGKGLDSGCYYWNPLENKLVWLREKFNTNDELDLFEDQLYYLEAPIWLFWSASLERRQFKYERSILYNTLIELGALLQNINLVGVSLGLGGCPFEVRRKKFESYFNLKEEEEPILLGYAFGIPVDSVFIKKKDSSVCS